MNKKFFIFGLIIIVGLIIVVLYLSFFLKQEKEIQSVKKDIIAKTWIEVLRPGVFELEKENETEIRQLQTGDELISASLIASDDNGLANIYLPDGSVVRLNSATKIVLEETNFDEQSEKLVVRIKLLTGRVWSKILELVTADSLWEVKTSNSISVVRGTSFGVEYLDGKTTIIGSENKVSVFAIDPKTKEIIKDREVVISPDKFIEIRDEMIEDIKKDKEFLTLSTKDISKEILEYDWIKRAKEADDQFNKKIDKLQQNDFKDKELRRKFRQQISEIIFEKKIEKGEKIEGERIEEKRIKGEKIEDGKEETIPPKVKLMPGGKEKISPTSSSEGFKKPIQEKTDQNQTIEKTENYLSLAPKPKALVIETASPLNQVVEGDRVFLKAILIMDDNSRRDITNIATWQVLGSIGRMEKPGIFLAELDPVSAELSGGSVGSIIAVWEDPQNNKNLLYGKTPIFNVSLKVIDDVETNQESR